MSCRVCPYNAFAAGAGKSKCTLCKPGFVTLQQGSTSSSQCIPQRKDLKDRLKVWVESVYKKIVNYLVNATILFVLFCILNIEIHGFIRFT